MIQDDIEIYHLMQICGSYKYDTQQINQRVINQMKNQNIKKDSSMMGQEQLKSNQLSANIGPYQQEQDMMLINGIE